MSLFQVQVLSMCTVLMQAQCGTIVRWTQSNTVWNHRPLDTVKHSVEPSSVGHSQTQCGTIVRWTQSHTDCTQGQLAPLRLVSIQKTLNTPPTWLFYPINCDRRNGCRVQVLWFKLSATPRFPFSCCWAELGVFFGKHSGGTQCATDPCCVCV